MSEPVFTFRLATPDDAEVLQAIYAPYVETTVTFEYVAPTVEEFRQRIIDRVSVYPYIVCRGKTGVPRWLRLCEPPVRARGVRLGR